MSISKINFLFSAGSRCNSVQMLIGNNLRMFSGPFDYLFIDIETVFSVIHTNMDNFLSDVVIFNKSKNIRYSNEKLNNLREKHICYMAHNYNNIDLRINPHYTDETLSGNLYEWKRICIFHHHNVVSTNIKQTILNRVNRFNKIIRLFPTQTALLHITKILHITNINEYVAEIVGMKEKYHITPYVIIIVCCDNLNSTSIFTNDILFVIKRVKSYNIQIRESQTDNDMLDYTQEMRIIRSYFDIELLNKSDTDAL